MKKEPLAIGFGYELFSELVTSKNHWNRPISRWMHGAEIMVQTNSWLFWRKTLGRIRLQQIHMRCQLHPSNTKSGKLCWWLQITPKSQWWESDYTEPPSKLWVLQSLQIYSDSRAKVTKSDGTVKWKIQHCNTTENAHRNAEHSLYCPPEYQEGLEIAYLAKHDCCHKRKKWNQHQMLETNRERTSETRLCSRLLQPYWKQMEITQVPYFPLTKLPAVAQTNQARMSYLVVTWCLSGADER